LLANLRKTKASVWRPSFLLALCMCFLGSCAGTDKVQEARSFRIIENVPFHPQETYQCGPASLAGVLNYWKIPVSPEKIAAEIYSGGAKGTLNIDLVLYAERMGLKANSYEGNLEDVRGNIDSGRPLIVLVDYGFWVYQKNHFMVVVGYDENGIIANSGREQHQRIAQKDFLKVWERTKFWTLRITPK
jgi:ABC-type bacteriocin/lantibiotic exporter with double-glycine peptidase domain